LHYFCFQFNGQGLWDLLLEHGTTCPDNVKQILKNTGYDNMCLLSNFKADDLQNITNFYRKTLHQLVDVADKEKFYGLYKNKPELYSLESGVGKSISLIADQCKRIMRKRQTQQSKVMCCFLCEFLTTPKLCLILCLFSLIGFNTKQHQKKQSGISH